MKKPKYAIQMYGLIFLCIGVAFIISGTLVAMDTMHPSSHSMVQDKNTMTLIFCMVGLGFCVVSVVLIFISRKKENKNYDLISNGKAVMGTVEKVQYKRGITFGKTSPYVVCFSYKFNAKNYRSKSYLIWEKSNFTEGDDIEVFVNDFGNCTVKM